MRVEELKNYKKILLLGFGKEGKSTLNFLHHYSPESGIGIADQAYDPEYMSRQKDYDLVVRSPGISKHLLTAPYTTAANIFFANVKGKVIGVTGSKGKSTTASLIHEILREAGTKSHLVGNIGNPALNELLHQNNADNVWVYELSSYNLDDLEYSPHISVFLNFFSDHMDYHGGVEEYWGAKKRIIARSAENDFLVYNQACPRLEKLAGEERARPAAFIEQFPFSKKSVRLHGAHNFDNVRAAVTVANILDIPSHITKRAVENFKPLPHRLENIGTFRGITFYDDANATTPEATVQALNALLNVATLLVGGQDRGYDFSDLSAEILKHGIMNLILFPESGAKIRDAILRINPAVPPQFYPAADMEEAVRLAYIHTPKDSVCLLSCASPSYSLWKNFEEKGDQFQKFVREIGN